MNFLYKLLLTFNSTFWVIVIYGIKAQWSLFTLPAWLFGIILLLIPILLSLLALFLSKFLSKDNLQKCSEVKIADSSFIPNYLGYFFVALSVENTSVLIFIYSIIFIFTYIASTQYFNPIYLLFGFHFYSIITAQHTEVFVVTRQIIRNAGEVNFDILYRINESAYIELRRKKDESINR